MNILDSNEAPKFSPSFIKHDLKESFTIGSIVPLKYDASDDDIGDSFKFSLSEGIHKNYFSINETNGHLKLLKALDYENNSLPRSFAFNIIATDTTLLSSNLNIIINITNVNEHDPIFLPTIYKGQVKENSPPGVTIMEVTATDADSDVFGHIDFVVSVLNEGSIFLEAVKISSTKAVIVTNKTPYDREKIQEQRAYVYANDGGGKSRRASLIITILDENDNPPT